MDHDELKERQRLVNQLCLDHLLRGLGTTVLRRKFKEIYAKLHGGKEWTNDPECGQRFSRSKWGNPAFVNAVLKQREMMQGGNIQRWDLHCLQSVITQMLTTALQDNKEEDKSSSSSGKTSSSGQSTPEFTWDRSWGSQMYHIRTLANIRHSIAHMPNEALTQGEFEEKWSDAVVALRGLGTKQEEIDDILQISQAAFNFPTLRQQGQNQGQGQLPDDQEQVAEEKEATTEESKKEAEQLRAKIQELQLRNENRDQVKCQDEVKDEVKGEEEFKDEVKGQMNNENVKLVVLNKKNELRADSLTKKGDLAANSGIWGIAREYYTLALEIPDISDVQRIKIHLNRSWVHLRILQMPDPPFNLNLCKSEDTETESGAKSKQSNGKGQSQSKWPKKWTSEPEGFHFTEGITDAESALQLLEAAGLNSSKALYRLAQFNQYFGYWKCALTYYDRALGQSDLDDLQLKLDRNICQLALLNQIEVEEFDWIPGKKNQTMAGLEVKRDFLFWKKLKDIVGVVKDPREPLLKANFLAQGLPWDDAEKQDRILEGQEVTATVSQETFEKVVQLYREAWKEGSPTGLYNLGLLLQEGNGVHQPDFSGAFQLFKMAASFPISDNGSITDKTSDWAMEGIYDAQYRLGLCYEFGLGVAQDEKKAVHWFHKATFGNHRKALRKLGDAYAQGLLGVPQDLHMAFFLWEIAARYGDTLARTSVALTLLQMNQSWISIWGALSKFSTAILRNLLKGSPTVLTTILERKRHFQPFLAYILQGLADKKTEFGGDKAEKIDREPSKVSWNVAALVKHILRIQHLLEVAQTPEFLQKLEKISPNWKSQSSSFVFTNRLVKASNCCVEGLAALQKLNQLYREALTIKETEEYEEEDDFFGETKYPPNLREISGLDPAILTKEGQLKTTMVTSFASSIRLVGSANFRDQPSLHLIQKILQKIAEDNVAERGVKNGGSAREKVRIVDSPINATLLLFYTYVLKEPGVDGEEGFADIQGGLWKRGEPFIDALLTVTGAAVQGSLEKFEEAAGDLEEALKQLNSVSFSKSRGDLLYVQAVCYKSAALTRGVNSANRKKTKEAMATFKKFLSICPIDEPRRSDAHYHLGLCTLYLEKMKVKGHSPYLKSKAKDILDKVLPLFDEGEAAEPDHFPVYKSPVKLLLIQNIEELQVQNSKKIQKVQPKSEIQKNLSSEGFGRFVDPFFKFPAESLPLRMREAQRLKVIFEFRRMFWGAHANRGRTSSSTDGPSARFASLASLYNMKESPFIGSNVYTRGAFVGCYEIVEPVLHYHYPESQILELTSQMTQGQSPKLDRVLGFTVVQDDSGAVFKLQFIMTYRGDGKDDEFGRIGEFQRGAQIIIHRPYIRLNEGGGTSLMVSEAEAQIFHLPISSTSAPNKCGFCGTVGGNLVQCSKCLAVFYCSQECQTADEDELKHACICWYLKPSSMPWLCDRPAARNLPSAYKEKNENKQEW